MRKMIRAPKLYIAPMLLAVVTAVTPAQAQQPPNHEVVRIWPGAAPGTEDWHLEESDQTRPTPGGSPLQMVTNVTVPTLTVFRPTHGRATGAAVIICPGGGFQFQAFNSEGTDIAQWLADRGITAFVLKYRIRPTAAFHPPADVRHNPEAFAEAGRVTEMGRQIAVADGIQAIHYLRANAAKYGIGADRIGMMGFSAGAVMTMGVILDGASPADRPNFAASIYGVQREDKTAPKDAPPLFIAAAQDDQLVPIQSSIDLFSLWNAQDLPAELHIYETGGHGFAWRMMNPHGQDKRVDNWPFEFETWLVSHGWANNVVAAH